jgi:predicted DNA-binding transcriptional regulator YafY
MTMIEGEPGLGYVLQPGYMLPPLMFSEEEIEAFVLGMRWVAKSDDTLLSGAAYKALTKVAAVLPQNLRTQLEDSSLLVGPLEVMKTERVDLPLIRQAIRAQVKTHITYCDLADETTTRTIWPFALAFFNHVRILVAWCEKRQGFRHFRVDRLIAFTPTNIRYPKNRQALLKEWRQIEGIPSPEA